MRSLTFIGSALLLMSLVAPGPLRAEWVAVGDRELLELTKRISRDVVSARFLTDQTANWERPKRLDPTNVVPEGEPDFCSAVLFDPARDSPANAMWRERLAWHGVSIIALEPAGKLERRTRLTQVCEALVRSFPQHAPRFRQNLRIEILRVKRPELVRPSLPWAYQSTESPSAITAGRAVERR